MCKCWVCTDTLYHQIHECLNFNLFASDKTVMHYEVMNWNNKCNVLGRQGDHTKTVTGNALSHFVQNFSICCSCHTNCTKRHVIEYVI